MSCTGCVKLAILAITRLWTRNGLGLHDFSLNYRSERDRTFHNAQIRLGGMIAKSEVPLARCRRNKTASPAPHSRLTFLSHRIGNLPWYTIFWHSLRLKPLLATPSVTGTWQFISTPLPSIASCLASCLLCNCSFEFRAGPPFQRPPCIVQQQPLR